jgi:hypothetical protein
VLCVVQDEAEGEDDIDDLLVRMGGDEYVHT